MTYDARRGDYSREHLFIIEIDLDFCTLTHGTAPCTAVETGDNKCFNTLASCNDVPNYTPADKTYRFCEVRSPHPTGISAIPCIDAVSTTAAKIDITGGLGTRSNVQVTMRDFPSNDKFFTEDKYTADRTYIGTDRGTFWTKLRARNPYYQGRAMRILSGYLVDGAYSAANFESRYYIIDKIDVSNGMAVITGKDTLKLADNQKAVAPAPSVGTLASGITAGQTSFDVSSGDGSDYAANDYIRIGREIMQVSSVSTDTLTVTRGQYNTTAEAHSSGDTVQLCYYQNDHVEDIIYDLLVNYAGVSSSFINLSAWAAERANYLNYTLEGLISEPTGINTLLKELSEQAPHFLFWDDRDQEIKFTAVKEPPGSGNNLNMDDNLIAGSVRVRDMEDLRISTVIVYYGQIDPTEKIDDARNYNLIYARIDSESITRYGSDKVKKVYARWISSAGGTKAKVAAARIGRRFSDIPRAIEFSLDAKDASLWAGDIAAITHRDVVDFTGQDLATLYQITSAQEQDTFDYSGLEFKWGDAVASDGSVLDPGEVVEIGVDSQNLNMRTIFDSEIGTTPDASTDFRLIILPGVIVGSSSTGSYALDTGTWPAGATVTLENRGYVVGKGGAGGADGSTSGGSGGPAINMQHDLELDNFGVIGGGGGGGGGADSTASGATSIAGGGGGAGNSVGAGAGSSSDDPGTVVNGQNGTLDNGGAGGYVLSTADAEAGDGGDLGSAGTTGTGDNTSSAGAAGAAITKNGNTLTENTTGTIYGTVS